MPRKIVLAVLAAVLGLGLVAAVWAAPKNNTTTTTVTTQTTSVNNGGNTPNCGNSCDQSHNPTDYEKPCAAVPGNGCHTLPDTPCERGHGGTEIGNKHCGSQPGLTMIKEWSSATQTTWTHDTLGSNLNEDVFYRITVTNPTSVAYTLTATDSLCDSGNVNAIPVSPDDTVPQQLAAGGTFQYTCSVDANSGNFGIPGNAEAGQGPYPLVNTATVTATPVGGGTSVTLTDSVTTNLN
jgi:hypothetical protein